MATTIEVARRGQITIPKALRDTMGIEEGQKYAVRALKSGILILTPQAGHATTTLAQLRKSLIDKGASLDDMLAKLRQEREAKDE